MSGKMLLILPDTNQRKIHSRRTPYEMSYTMRTKISDCIKCYFIT